MVFDKLRKAFTKATSRIKETVSEKVAYKEIRESDIADVLDDLLFTLVEADVAYDVAYEIVEHIKGVLVGRKLRRGTDVGEYVKSALKQKILEIVDLPRPDLEEEALKRGAGDPLVIVFLGVNGVGKTTTIAKFAYRLKKAGITPVLAAADTFRAGAQEQLEIHAERLGIPIVKGRYGSDPASVAHDAIMYAKSRGFKAVLVDTAGRMHVDYDLMGELRKIVRVARPDYKVLVVDALTGNDAVEQAVKFNGAVGVDAVIVTKADADTKGGTILSVSYTIKRPVVYLGTGQKYEDLEPFDPRKYVEMILG
ncbi:MAG: signal recognition particle-docking protein FtsY [Desulfurococcales archaeon]|nr:signal recognition particle-docking protein FtsY [Desulfurococcales archaeon]